MKKLIHPVVYAVLVALISCDQRPKQPEKINTGNLRPGKHYYMAIFEKDSARLTVNVAATGRITGTLLIKYTNTDTVTLKRQPTDGTFVGEFKGDTLRADYTFNSGPKGKTLYTNPIALLHKGDSMVMGHGRIYDYLGRTYFDDRTPIIYTKSRFTFLPADRKKKSM